MLKDKLNTNGERVMAWVIRMAWGHTSLYCVLPTGEPAYASDWARDLKINPGTVSRILAFKEQRGYLERRGVAKVIYPVIAPVLAPDEPEKLQATQLMQRFSTAGKLQTPQHMRNFRLRRLHGTASENLYWLHGIW